MKFQPTIFTDCEPVRFNVRVRPDDREAFHGIARAKGTTAAEMVRNFMASVIAEDQTNRKGHMTP